jgi:flagellar secretion chaperone FliS
MHTAHAQEYLTQQVMTAAPQKLQLLLIEAAIRNCLRARDDYRAGEYLAGGEPILKAQEIVTELLSSARQDPENALGKQVAALYAFLFRTLIDAHMKRDVRKLDDALRILNEERETWRLVCEQMGSTRQDSRGIPAPLGGGFSYEA